MLACSAATPAPDLAQVKATITRWIASLNKDDLRAVAAACAAHAAIVDGFPPYAWRTRAGWMHGYEANNKAIRGTPGILSLGRLIHAERHGNDAYVIYASTFTDEQDGKPVVYKGTMTMTPRKTGHGWVFTGAASAWGVNSL